jgi:hypothetical protein
MRQRILAAAAAILATALLPSGAVALTNASPLAAAFDSAAPLQRTAVVCGTWGCREAWPGRHWGWRWPQPWRSYYPPACPFDYHYDCRPGPYGGRQCACWPDW